MKGNEILYSETNMSDQNPGRHIQGLHHLFFFFSVPTEQTILEHSVTLRMGESHRQVKGVRGSSRQKEMIPTLSLEEGLDQRSTLVPTRPACVRSAVMLVSKGSGAAIIPTSQCLGWQMGLCLNSLVGGGEMHSKSGPLS